MITQRRVLQEKMGVCRRGGGED